MEGTTNRPRLSIFRGGAHIYAQVIDDTTGRTLASASSLDETLRNFKPAKKETSAAQSKAAEQEETLAAEMAASGTPVKGKGARVAKAPTKGASHKKGHRAKAASLVLRVKQCFPARKGARRRRQSRPSPPSLITGKWRWRVKLASWLPAERKKKVSVASSLIVVATPIMGAWLRSQKALVKSAWNSRPRGEQGV